MRGPTRPRSHAVETVAQRTFEALVPESWALRRQDADYGIDYEVELFEQGHATGEFFKVQLKGRSGAGRRRSLRLKTGQFLYWRSLPVPVLIVLVDTDQRVAFARWVHAIDDLKRFNPIPPNFSISFSERTRLTASSFTSIARDVRLFLSLRARQVPWPLPLSIEGSGAWSSAHVAALRNYIDIALRQSGLIDVNLAPNEQAPGLSVEVSDSEIRVVLPGGYASSSMETETAADQSPESARALAADICILFAASLVSAGMSGPALSAARGSIGHSAAAQLPEVQWRLLSAYIAEGSATDLVDLIEVLTASEELSPTADIVLGYAIERLERRAGPEADRLANVLIRQSEALEAAGDSEAAATCAWNAALVRTEVFDFEAALGHFARAARLSPVQAATPVFFVRQGGALWHTGRYAEAAESYASALESGGNAGDVLPLLADARLCQGEFLSARAALSGWDPGEEVKPLGSIVFLIADYLVDGLGITAQDRAPITEDELEAAGENVERLAELLQRDAIDPRVWCRLGALAEPPFDQRMAFTIGAHQYLHAAEVWAAAAQCWFSSDEVAVCEVIMAQGAHLCGNDFLLAAETPCFEDVELPRPYFELLHATFAARPRKPSWDPVAALGLTTSEMEDLGLVE